MKKLFIAALVTFSITNSISAQEKINLQDKYTAHNKGKFFVSWGGNRESYSKSDVNFRGKDYNFTIEDMPAHDKPKGWHMDYINPSRMTIPQTNLRLGYFFSDHYSVTIGLDHMKYVMYQDRNVKLNGTYPNQVSFDELIAGRPDEVLLTEKFLKYEHTDGLNYINTEVSRFDDISALFGLPNTDKVQINLTEGIGFGLLYPKTNTTLMGKERHDDFHISGYGTSAKVGLNVTFFKHFYIQGEMKGGYINMQDIRTTKSTEDSASQDFFFLQRIIAFGGIFKI